MARKRRIKKRIRDASPGVVLILSILIILVSIIVSYLSIKNNKKELEAFNKAIEECEEEGIALKKVEDKILLVSRITGWREEAEWRDPKGSWTNLKDLKTELNKWVSLLKEKYKIEAYKPWPETIEEKEPEESEEERKRYLTIVDLIAQLEQLTDANRKSAERLFPPRDKARREEIGIIGIRSSEGPEFTSKGKLVKMEESKNKEIASLRESTQAIEPRIKEIIDQGEQKVTQLARQVKELSQNLGTTIIKYDEEIAKLEQELAKYEERLEKLKKRVEFRREGVEIDGGIIVADIANGYVYISVGRQHALPEGIEFDVFDIQKGGLKQDRGRIRVFKIYDKYSEASIIRETMDLDYPIAVGNYINSLVYNPKKAKTFVFVGRLIGKYSAAELKQQVEEFGGKVIEEITPDITYVVVGEGIDFDKDEEYIKAVHLGALTIREKEVYTMLGAEWE